MSGVVTVRSGLAQTSSGSWSTVAPLPTPRYGLAAATDANGRIYALGGGARGDPLATVEAYDSSTNAWSTVASMTTERLYLAATTGRDGRIYALGGINRRKDILSSVEAYTPATDTWSTVAPMPTPRWGLAAATGLDGRIYALGGLALGGTFHGDVSTVEVYDPSTHNWSTVAPLPTPLGFLGAATGSDGRIYAIGGGSLYAGSSVTYAYTPSTNTWSTVASLPAPRHSAAATTALDGRIYLLGGVKSEPIDTATAYDPSSNSWTDVTSMPTARWGLGATTGPDGGIYAIGGCCRTSAGEAIDAVEVYRPAGTPRVVVSTVVSPVVGVARAITASVTVSFSSTVPGEGEVYFGSGPGCLGLVETATRDLHPGTTEHAVVVTGSDLPGTVGDNGILPGVTYFLQVVTVTRSGMEVENNNGKCYKVTIPTS